MKKNLFKKALASLTILAGCLLLAAAPLPPAPDTEEPGETTETGGGETEPGIEPQNDDTINKDIRK